MQTHSGFTDRRVRIPAIAAILAICSGAFVTSASSRAQPAPSAAAAAAATTVEIGDVDLQNSRVYVRVGKTGLGHEHAVEGRLKSGRLLLTGETASSVVEFDMTTFAADGDAARKYIGLSGTTSPQTQRAVTSNMLGPDVLNIQKYPTAQLDRFKVVPLADQSARGLPQYQVDCRLTLHGVSRSVRFNVEAASNDGWARIRGAVAIRQSDFGIKPYSTALGAVGVADVLTIYGDLSIAEQRFTSKPAAP